LKCYGFQDSSIQNRNNNNNSDTLRRKKYKKVRIALGNMEFTFLETGNSLQKKIEAVEERTKQKDFIEILRDKNGNTSNSCGNVVKCGMNQGCGSGLDPDSVDFWIWIQVQNPDPDPVARNNSYIVGTKEAEASNHSVNVAR
jgi:hypothetical protein